MDLTLREVKETTWTPVGTNYQIQTPGKPTWKVGLFPNDVNLIAVWVVEDPGWYYRFITHLVFRWQWERLED